LSRMPPNSYRRRAEQRSFGRDGGPQGGRPPRAAEPGDAGEPEAALAPSTEIDISNMLSSRLRTRSAACAVAQTGAGDATGTRAAGAGDTEAGAKADGLSRKRAASPASRIALNRGVAPSARHVRRRSAETPLHCNTNSPFHLLLCQSSNTWEARPATRTTAVFALVPEGSPSSMFFGWLVVGPGGAGCVRGSVQRWSGPTIARGILR
jgi:hypothetical protein